MAGRYDFMPFHGLNDNVDFFANQQWNEKSMQAVESSEDFKASGQKTIDEITAFW